MYKLWIGLFFLAVVVVLGFGCYYYHEKSESYCSLYKNAMANTDFLIKQREKEYADTLALREQNRQLEEAVGMDKSSFDWSFPIADSPVILRLQSN